MKLKNKMNKIILYLLFSINLVFSQQIITKGVPFIEHFDHKNGKTYAHIWSIDEAPNHIMYFVNEKGLLEYDGENWKIYSGSRSITRSLKVINNNLIYTGSDNDFGVWKKNKSGKFIYKSLFANRNKKNIAVEEFWHVYQIGEATVFQSFQNLYVYENNQFTKIKAPTIFVTGYQSKNKVFIIDKTEGIFHFDGANLNRINIPFNESYDQIVAVDELEQELRIITKNKGIYIYKNQVLDNYISLQNIIPNDEVFSYQGINKDYFALGTIQNGVIIVNINGDLIHKINKSKGLQNNTVLSMYYSNYGKLWLGLDFGIDVLHFNTPLSYVFDYQGRIGTTYASVLDGENILLGTNQGLYTLPFNELTNINEDIKFQLVSNSEGQVWSLYKMPNLVLCGHNKGLFEVKNNQLKQVDTKRGVWDIEEMFGYILTGNYNGIYVYKNENNKITYYKTLENVIGSFNQLEVYGNKLFAVIPNEGVLEFTLDKDFNIKSKKVYKKQLFGNVPFRISAKNNILTINTLDYNYTKKIGSNEGFKKTKNTQNEVLKKHLLNEYFQPNILNNGYELYSIYNGFALKNNLISLKYPYAKIPSPQIRKTLCFNNKKIENIPDNGIIPYQMNNVRINYIVPNNDNHTEYRYKLDGYEDTWSAWTTGTYVEFISLKEGNYTLLLEAKLNEKISTVTEYKFTINPPFYRTWWAYLIYFLLLIGLIYWLKQYNQIRLKKQKLDLLKIQKENLNEQSRIHHEKLMEERQEKLELERQQLKMTIEQKELELAKKIIDQKEINTLIASVKKKIEEVQNQSSQKLTTKHYNDLMSFLDKKIDKELNKEYEIAFDNSQTHFYENLLKTHPNLSSKDLRICSYLMMNLTSKEIAKIFQVLPSSIDVNRSRLRKKLGLEETDSLRDYLSRFN